MAVNMLLKFLGVLRIEDLLAANGDSRLASLMNREAPVARPGVGRVTFEVSVP